MDTNKFSNLLSYSFSMPLSPCDANTGASCITCTKSHFDYCDITNTMMPLAIALASQCTDIVQILSRHKKTCLVIVQTNLDTS